MRHWAEKVGAGVQQMLRDGATNKKGHSGPMASSREMGVESQTRKTFLGATMMGDGRRGIEWDWEEWQWGEAEEGTNEGRMHRPLRANGRGTQATGR